MRKGKKYLANWSNWQPFCSGFVWYSRLSKMRAKQRKIPKLRVSEQGTLGTKEEAATAMHTAASAKKPRHGQAGILNRMRCLSFTYICDIGSTPSTWFYWRIYVFLTALICVSRAVAQLANCGTIYIWPTHVPSCQSVGHFSMSFFIKFCTARDDREI